MRRRRGFTIAETLVVAVILGMMLTAIVGAIAPLFGAPDRAQAKSDSVEPAAAGLYLMERDIRQSDANGVFACAGQPLACGDGALNQAQGAVAVLTAESSSSFGSQFSLANDGSPAWEGFVVYWQSAPGQPLYRSWEHVSVPTQASRAVLQGLAAQAVVLAWGDPSPVLAMHNIDTLSALVTTASSDVSLHIVAMGSVGSHTNTTTIDTDIFARN